jgi:hypothetical protein
MDPDAEFHPLGFGQTAVVAGDLLRLDRALHGLHDAGKLGDDGVTPGVDDAPVVALDQRSHGIAVTTQRRERTRFVGLHEAGVPLDVGAQKRH